MDKKILIFIFTLCVATSYGFGIKEILDFLLGDRYGQHYPSQYPQYPQRPGLYPGNHPGGYPGSNYPIGPPGAHPGCPLCDSSVYSYCSYKQAHDACCCDNDGYNYFGCQKSDCNFLYANSCEEYNLISSCCCIDLQKNAPALAPVLPLAPGAVPIIG